MIVHVGDLDPQQLLADYMSGLMAALEERRAIIPKPFDRPSRVVRSMIGGEIMRNRPRHAGRNDRKKSKGRRERERERNRKRRGSSSDEDSADSDSDSSDVSYHSDTSTGGLSENETKSKSRSTHGTSSSSSSSSAARKRAQQRSNSDDDFPMPLPLPLPLPVVLSQAHMSGMLAGSGGHQAVKIDPRVGFLKGGRIRRRKGKDILERALMKNAKGFTETKWRITLLGTLTALRPSGLFTAAMHLHFEIAYLFFKDKTLASYEKIPDKLPFTFAASSIISRISLQFAMRNFVFSDHLQRMFSEEHIALIECRSDDTQIDGLIDALIADLPLSVYADEEVCDFPLLPFSFFKFNNLICYGCYATLILSKFH